jgi:taurine dioxygenase
MKFERLSPVTGARVDGVDLSRELSPSEIRSIEEALSEYHLLLFRRQEFDAARQKRLAE